MNEPQENICQCGHGLREDHYRPNPIGEMRCAVCDCNDFRAGKEEIGTSSYYDEPLPAPSQPSLKVSECSVPKKCEVKDCHNGFITRYIGGSIDSEPCPCSCHRAPKNEKDSTPSLKSPEDKIAGIIKEFREIWKGCFGRPEEGDEVYWPHKYFPIEKFLTRALHNTEQSVREKGAEIFLETNVPKLLRKAKAEARAECIALVKKKMAHVETPGDQRRYRQLLAALSKKTPDNT